MMSTTPKVPSTVPSTSGAPPSPRPSGRRDARESARRDVDWISDRTSDRSLDRGLDRSPDRDARRALPPRLPGARPEVPDVPSATRLRRLALALPTLALASLVAGLAYAVVGAPTTPLAAAVLATFVLGMTWQGFVAWQYVYGFVAAFLPGLEGALERESRLPSDAIRALRPDAHPNANQDAHPDAPASRTAAVVAIHAEDPVAVFAGLRVMARSLARGGVPGEASGEASGIDLFVLSDTRDPAIAAAEAREFALLEAWAAREGEAVPGSMPGLRYRRRADNAGRKAGNIAEFCDTYGPEYEFMIVLDADSLMTGEAMRRLVRLMEAHPRVGLIQTVSYAAGRDTLFARLQQFAVRLYAPLGLRCLETWQGADGGYWGHNAIVRIAPFREHARLPVLPGAAPLGGEILCHDTVEGALLRRAGWEVRLLPEMEGTWEEMPTNIIDLLGRERRWCQGNLQHLGVVGMPGLRAASRAHLGIGILAYLVAPLWVLFFGLGTLEAVLHHRLGLLAYGLGEPGRAAAGLAALCLGLVVVPRILCVVHALADARRRAGFGGAARLVASALLEQAVWFVLWPVVVVFNAGAVVSTFRGRVVRWDAQARSERRVPWREAFRLQASAVLMGAGLAALLAFARDPGLALWMGPIALSLLASPALSVWTSRVDLGAAARRAGLFLTVDETACAPELRELARDRVAGAALAVASAAPTGLAPRRAGEAPVWLTTGIDDAKASPPR